MQQDQGFSSERQLELIVVEYTPTAIVKPYKPKQYTNNLKLVHSIPANEKAIFINADLENQHRSHFRSKYNSQIVYQVGDKPSKRSYGLIFDSNYEHANLQYVISEDLKHYQLYIKPDSNTNSHYQWFCFKVKNKMIKKTTFTIKNFLKENMLYRKGLKPYFKYLKPGQRYYHQLANEVKFQKSSNEDSDFYQLTFSFEFETNNDEVQFCSQPPYTYSRLQHIYNNSSLTRITISKSILGHNIDAFLCNQHSNYKAVVVVFARQHPGEPVGSWMMEGFANRLIEMSQEEVLWILVPMINIDGVVVGNNRTGLLGYDFNRHWFIDKDTNRYHLFPEIVGIMRYFKKKHKDFSKKIKIFIDFHGHSSQSGVFSYGPPHQKQSQYYQLCRFLPYLIHSKNPDFSLAHSHYELSPSKKYCARSIFFQRFGFPYSYTIQSSFGLYNNRRINEVDMLKMGESVCQALNQFIQILLCSSSKAKVKEKIGQLMKLDESVAQNGCNYDDSDSEEEDDRVPARAEFQDRIVNFLTRNHRPKQLKSATQTQIHSKSKIQPQLIEKTISHERTPSLRHRYKTDNNLLFQKPTDRQSSLSLPRIKKKYGSSETPKQSSALDYSFNNLSLSEIKQKLYCIRHSKLGKKLLIGTRL